MKATLVDMGRALAQHVLPIPASWSAAQSEAEMEPFMQELNTPSKDRLRGFASRREALSSRRLLCSITFQSRSCLS